MNVIFDWAGTLADDARLTWSLTNDTLQHFGAKAISFEEYKNDFRPPADEFYRKHLPATNFVTIEAWFQNRCLEAYLEVPLFPGIENFVKQYSSIHHFAILSSLNSELLKRCILKLGLSEAFLEVKGAALDKSSAAQDLMDSLGFKKPETILIGDMPHDILSAKKVGIQSAGVTYGYASEAELLLCKPDHVFHSPEELHQFLDKTALQESALPIVTVGGLIVNSKNQFLLVRTEKWSNLYGTPGGKVEWGETLEAAFCREINEETGLDIDEIRFVMIQDCVFHPQFYKQKHFVLVNYVAKLKELSQPAQVILNYESNDFVWVSWEDAQKLPINQPTLILMQKSKELGYL